jgi:hypothetical protein
VKEIELTQGYKCQVSDRDFKELSLFKWQAKIIRRKDGSILNVYANRNVWINNKCISIRMHRMILRVTDPKVGVDHRDHNGLNNQRKNLRKATTSQNTCNSRLSSLNTSGFKGVSWHSKYGLWGKWEVVIRVKGKKKFVGSTTDPIEAAKMYDRAALKHYGKFALTNEKLGLLRSVQNV